MLAVASIRIVSDDLPAGGVAGLTQVGLSRMSSTRSSPTALSARMPAHRRAVTAGGRRQPYQTSRATPTRASVSHKTAGIRGSKVSVPTFSGPKQPQGRQLSQQTQDAAGRQPNPE